MNGDLSGKKQPWFKGSFLLLLLLLGGTLSVLCRQGFLPYQVFWANDVSLGAWMEDSSRLPGAIFACWADFWWIGGPNAAFPPTLTNICMAILSPEHHLKFYAPGSMLFLGFSAWFFFRQLRFAPMVCVIGGLGAGLNMHFLSNACWGLGQWNVCCAMILIAMGVLVSSDVRPLWLKGALAGFCTGMAVMEGYDVGAILSIYVGVFLAFLFLTREGTPLQRAGRTALVGVVVVVAAVLISLSTIYTLVATQLSGTGGGGAQTKRAQVENWNFTTQWSIPKMETLRVIIPGLFGYRMQEFTTSTNKAGSYWGRIAEDPRVQDLASGEASVRTNAAAMLGVSPEIQALVGGDDMKARAAILSQVKDQVQRRHTGNGEYAGVLVCLLAVFGLASSARKTDSPYSAEERRAVWFWGGVGLFSLLAAWGRFGFIYGLIYHLPYLSTIRSPMKFMHPLNISLIILSGYGLETLYRGYLSRPAGKAGSASQSISQWWEKAAGFERKWVVGSALALIVAAAGYFAVRAERPDLTGFLAKNGFDEDLSGQIADFCAGEVALFAVYLALSVGVLIWILSKARAGRQAAWAWGLLSVIMICDLYRADAPWIRYYNYKEKISPNPVVELLRQKPWEHRVVSRLSPTGPYDIGGPDPNFGGLCHWWLENDYPFNNIQSLEIDQAPRMPDLDSSYLGNFNVRTNSDLTPPVRLWQLTNTRYVFANVQLEAALNQLAEPKNSFRTVMRMDWVTKPGVAQVEDAGDLTVVTNTTGALALIEFKRALPRAKLFSQWQVTEDQPCLQTLASPRFDPEKTVLVAKDTPLAQVPTQPGAEAGTVEFSHYESRDLVLQADAKTPAVLLLNDHTGDFWNVWVDQKQEAMLRCNYIMRGVFVPPGKHTIEFRYQPPRKMLYTSLTAFAAGLLLGGYVVVTGFARDRGSKRA